MGSCFSVSIVACGINKVEWCCLGLLHRLFMSTESVQDIVQCFLLFFIYLFACKDLNPCLLFTAPCGFSNVDLVFAFDSSASVTRENFLSMLELAKAIVKDADIDSGSVRVGAIIYSSVAQTQFDLHAYSSKNDIQAAIDRIPYMPGRTNTAEALRTIRTKMFKPRKGDRNRIENVVVLISGSESDRNKRKTIPEARKLWSKKIHVYAVGVGLENTQEIHAIATPPASENSFAVRSYIELSALSAKIVEGRCKGSEHNIAK